EAVSEPPRLRTGPAISLATGCNRHRHPEQAARRTPSKSTRIPGRTMRHCETAVSQKESLVIRDAATTAGEARPKVISYDKYSTFWEFRQRTGLRQRARQEPAYQSSHRENLTLYAF